MRYRTPGRPLNQRPGPEDPRNEHLIILRTHAPEIKHVFCWG